jgi:hypothetical protein
MACMTCGRPIPPDSRRRRYCSPACARRRPNRRQTPPDPVLRSHARRVAVAHVRATQPNDYLTGLPIDLTRDRQRDPLGSCVDEIYPRALGGSAIDPANLGHTTRLANGIKGSTWPVTPELRARCRARVEAAMRRESTTRRW